MDAEGKVALVTGGASGLGRATVAALLSRGTRVVVADLPGTRPSGASQDAWTAFHPTDVTEEADVRAAVELAVERFGGLHIAISCAGIHRPMRLFRDDAVTPVDPFSSTLAVNTLGTFNVLRFAGFAMRNNDLGDGEERGVVINTGSVAAFEGQIGHVAYSASKAAVSGMTLPAARELARWGIRVVTIAPGIFETAMVADVQGDVDLAAAVQHPRRLGRPEEFADLACHVVGNPYLNGGSIRLDGGARLPPR
jgi:3-hydroxyacyl-CoA dehydrogenase / 3-hydroxy-2-methylbutyryl-CoA dehydrogenase